MYQQCSLWAEMFEAKHINKPVRLIEMFAGIGAQHKALSNLGVAFETYKIAEWAVPSILAYNAIHTKDFTDYSLGKTKEEMLERIKGVSQDYNTPIKGLEKKPIEWIKNVYNNCVATHNLINIMNVHGKDLEIVDTDKYEYILTYSFPCQDLSLAGKRCGMTTSQSEGGTRSGLLWEVERILNELKTGDERLPQILIMENVPDVVSSRFVKDFQKWRKRLEELGYQNYEEILNAKDFGIRQNRKRCFMVSVLGDSFYEFPCKRVLQHKLKEFLEKDVDQKYFLKDNHLKVILRAGGKYDRKEVFKCGLNQIDKGIAVTILTRQRNAPSDNYIILDSYNGYKPTANIGTILATYQKQGHGSVIVDVEAGLPIKEATKKGYKIANVGDGIDISGRMEYHRGAVQEGKAQTITTTPTVGVVVNEPICINPKGGRGGKEGLQPSLQNRIYSDEGVAPAVTTCFQPNFISNLVIRKLTPKECMRLMGFDDKDYEAMRAIGMSDAAIYHCAGDSIVVNVLVEIFRGMFKKDNNN